MEAKAVPIKATQATVLTPTDKTGVSRVKVLHPNERFNLPWDRYIRLNAAAEQDQAWAIVVAVDVLEHVPPEQRAEFLTELSRVTREFCPSV